MKLFTGWIAAAALALAASGAQAQLLSPAGNGGAVRVSYFDGPYAAMPPRDGYGPVLLPPMEVYTVVRESGFSPLGIPRQRGFVYTIAVIDRSGEDGRLVIDARNGRIIRFVPAYRIGGGSEEDLSYGPAGPHLPAATLARVPRPPASIPHVASRTTPVPKPSPQATRPAEPRQQSAAVQAQSVPSAPAAPPVVEAKPVAPAIQPTQEMPKVQGLE